MDGCGFLIKRCILNHQIYLNLVLEILSVIIRTQNLGQPLIRFWDEDMSAWAKALAIQAACEYAELHMNFYYIKEKG